MRKQIDADEQDAFIREVSEEVKNDNLRQLWEKHGLLIIILIALALTAAVSFETFRSWKLRKDQTWSDTYAYALNLQVQGRYDESLKVFENIEKENSGIFADISKLQTANILFEQGKNDEALKKLSDIVADTSVNGKLRNVAAIKLASYKLDTAPREEIDALLRPLIEENGSWSNIAREMTAMVAIRDGNTEEARALYNTLLQTPDLPESMKLRVQDMLSVLDNAD